MRHPSSQFLLTLNRLTIAISSKRLKSDGFLDDSDATESDDCSEWGLFETTTSTEPTTSTSTEQDTDAAAEVEHAILVEIRVMESGGSRTSEGASCSGKKDPT